MLPLHQLLDACRHETEVIKHLATRLPDGALEFRPTAAQRSTAELLRYLTVTALIPAIKCRTGNWDHAQTLSAAAATVTLENFAAAMDSQMDRVAEELATLDEQAAAATPAAMPWGAPTPLAAVILRTVYAPLVAYRMQLFLYAKQAGNAELKTYECWAGAPPESA